MTYGQAEQTVRFDRLRPAVNVVSKVPEVTIYFWITKVLTTGMGEVTSDYLVQRFSPFIAVGIGFVIFAASMVLQFRARRYRPWAYWTAVVMVSVFGTMCADVLHVGLGIPYVVSTTFYAIVLIVVFAVWYRTEKTLSIHSIYTPRREVFYWLTVITTFALGTAAGDMTATTLGLGYLASGILFAVIIAVPALAHWKLGLNSILAFWFAYIVTRPLGASFADWLGQPTTHAGGLGFGLGTISLVLTAVIVGLVGYLAITRKDTPELTVADS
ncbi:MAG TPA: hypothetical protein VG317_16495 [Pseudonocardiaceae bacterium]|nr:hypothetical protein [Pseudonocardiaceae bacterium]